MRPRSYRYVTRSTTNGLRKLPPTGTMTFSFHLRSSGVITNVTRMSLSLFFRVIFNFVTDFRVDAVNFSPAHWKTTEISENTNLLSTGWRKIKRAIYFFVPILNFYDRTPKYDNVHV